MKKRTSQFSESSFLGLRSNTPTTLLISLLLASTSLSARAGGVYSWNVIGTNNWTDTSSWSPTTLPGAGDTVDFTQRALSGTNNVTVTTGTAGTINIGGNKAYLIQGGTITMNNGLSDSAINIMSTAAGNNTISSNLQIAGDGNLNIVNNENAALALTGTIFGISGGTSTASITNTVAGATIGLGGLSDNGGSLALTLTNNTGSGKFTFGTGNTYTGPITLVSGSAVLAAGGGLGASGTMTIEAGGCLDINGKGTISKNFILNGSGINGSGAILDNVGTAGALSGTIQLATNSTISVGSGILLTTSGPITGSGGLALVGGGTLVLGGSSSYSGGTTITSGTVRVNSSQWGLGSTSGNVAINGGALDMQKSGTVGALSGSSAALITNNSATAAITLTSSFASGTSTYAGVISDGSKAISLTKAGNGTLVLAGTNGYSGVTSVAGGSLQFAKEGSLYNNNATGQWTTTNIVVNSGAMLALNVGGANEFTASDVGTLAALGNSTGGFKNGSTLGLDTTGTSNFIYAAAIANPNAGSNVLGVTKLGANTLTLNGVNTYTGATTVSSGTLVLNGSLVAASAVAVNSGATLAGSGTAAGSVSIAGGGFLNPGAVGSVGTLRTGSVAFNTGSVFGVDIADTSADLLAVTGSAVLSGTVAVNGTLTLGKYILLTTTGGTTSGNFTSLTGASSYRLNTTSNEVDLMHLATISLSAVAANTNVHVGDSATVNFNLGNTAPDNSDTLHYSLSGNLSGTGAIAANNSTVVGATVTNAGAGMTTVNAGAASTDSYGSSNSPQSASATVTGYNRASAGAVASTVNLGVIHKNGSFNTSAISVTNVAPSGYTEGLNVNVSGTTGSATATGSVSNLVAGGTSTNIAVGLIGSTASAGQLTGAVTLGMVSNGANSGLENTTLDSQTVNVTGQVNEYAQPTLTKTSGVGTLTQTDATTYFLNLGTFDKNTGTYKVDINALNTFLSDYQDSLGGSVSGVLSSLDLSGATSFSGVAAGGSASGWELTLDTTGKANQTYTDTLTFSFTSTNESSSSSLGNTTLDLQYSVVPEPSTWAMFVGGFGMLIGLQRLRKRQECK